MFDDVYVTINDSWTGKTTDQGKITSDYIISISASNSAILSQEGNECGELSFSFYPLNFTDDILNMLKNEHMQVTVYVKRHNPNTSSGYEKYGTYYIENIEKNENEQHVTIIAYDILYKLNSFVYREDLKDKRYRTLLAILNWVNATSEDLKSLQDKYKFEYKYDTIYEAAISQTTGYLPAVSIRECFRLIGEAVGSFVYQDEDGNIQFRKCTYPFSDEYFGHYEYTITDDDVVKNSFTINKNESGYFGVEVIEYEYVLGTEKELGKIEDIILESEHKTYELNYDNPPVAYFEQVPQVVSTIGEVMLRNYTANYASVFVWGTGAEIGENATVIITGTPYTSHESRTVLLPNQDTEGKSILKIENPLITHAPSVEEGHDFCDMVANQYMRVVVNRDGCDIEVDTTNNIRIGDRIRYNNFLILVTKRSLEISNDDQEELFHGVLVSEEDI